MQNFASIQPRTSSLKFAAARDKPTAPKRGAEVSILPDPGSPLDKQLLLVTGEGQRETVSPQRGASDRGEGGDDIGFWGYVAAKLDRARSRLYRSEILQENMRLKALAEIYTMHSFALL